VTAQTLPIPERLAQLDTITLHGGAHPNFNDGHCALEVVAWLAGEPHTDRPECTCPVIAAFGRTWNDALPNEDRDRLIRDLTPRMVGTRGTAEIQDRRAIRCADWAVRVHAPAWLRLAGLDDHADTLAGLDPLSTIGALQAATSGPIAEARQAAAAAWDAAGAAAGAAAWDAAGAAAWDAAGAAAGAAAWDAAGAAAWDAAGAAAWAAAWDAAGAAARDAAGAAAWDAARAAAWDALAPTVSHLQEEARLLVVELCEMSDR